LATDHNENTVLTDNPHWEISCPDPYLGFINALLKAWCFAYFNRSIRNMTITFCKVVGGLIPIFTMVLCCFVAHFFIFQGFAATTFGEGGFGVKSHYQITAADVITNNGTLTVSLDSRTVPNDSPNAWDALYNQFGLMTTVNHPDVLMYLVDQYTAVLIFIMTFIFTVNIICNNLLLAIVYGDFCSIYEEAAETDALMRIDMVNYAFDLIDKEKTGFIKPQQLIEILIECDGDRVDFSVQDGDFHEMMVHFIDNKVREDNKSHHQLQNAAPQTNQDGMIDKEDMHELLVFYNLPIRIKPLTKPAHRFMFSKERLENAVANAVSERAERVALRELAWMESISLERWCATFPWLYHIFFEYGAGAEIWINSYNPWGGCGLLSQCHTLTTVIFSLFAMSQSSNAVVSQGYINYLLLLVGVQSIYCALNAVAEMRPWQPWHIFNPNTKKLYKNVSNLIVCAALWLEFLARCTEHSADPSEPDSCFTQSRRDTERSLTTYVACTANIMVPF